MNAGGTPSAAPARPAFHCPHCGAQGHLTPDPTVTQAWINWQDETSGDDWQSGPEVTFLTCGTCGGTCWLGLPSLSPWPGRAAPDTGAWTAPYDALSTGEPQPMSDLTRLNINLPALTTSDAALLRAEVLMALRRLARQGGPLAGVLTQARVTVPVMASAAQAEQASRSEGFSGHITALDAPEFVSGRDTDGGYVTALVWVEGIAQPVTFSRLNAIRKQGFLSGTEDAVLRDFLMYVHERRSPVAHVSTADLEDLFRQYVNRQA